MSNNLWRLVVIGVLSVVLTLPARAESIDTAAKQIVAGIVVASAAVAVGVTLLILHAKHKTSAITGCVSSEAGGMSVTDEKDKRIYTLSGDPLGIKSGDRMTLEGKRRLGGKVPIFEARSVTKDFGACQP
jgi:hypothetical protein